MNDLFEKGKEIAKEFIKSNIKSKIVLFGGPIIFLLFLLIVVCMWVVPVAKGADLIESFKAKTASIIDRIGNFLAGRPFINITDTTIEDKEMAFQQKLNDFYLMYLNYGKVEINAPLILAATYFPLNATYDKDTYTCLNGANTGVGTPEEIEKACKNSGIDSNGELFDYWTEKQIQLYNLIRHGVVKVTTTYECNEVTSVDEDGEEHTYYVQGDVSGTPDRQIPFGGSFGLFLSGSDFPTEGDFEPDEVCESTTPIKKYTYEWDEETFDKYLKEVYIPTSPEYLFSKNLTAEEKEDRLDQTVQSIHDLSELYYYLFQPPTLVEAVYGGIPYDIASILKVPLGRGIGSDGKNDYRITSCFQRQRALSNGIVRDHQGIDLTVRGSDQNIYAAADGIVTSIKTGMTSSCYNTGCARGESEGNYVKLRHEINGIVFYTFYFHLSSVNSSLAVGDPVTSDTALGIIGSTGNSSGTHLHFQYEDANGNPVNPGNLFTNPFEIASGANCAVLTADCASRNSAAAISSSYGNWQGQQYPIAVRVNGNSPIPLEQYILGVTLNEMPSGYSIEAIKAQMVAARTYTFGSQRFRQFALENNQIVIDMGLASQATQTFNLNKICSLDVDAQAKMIDALDRTRGQVLLTTDNKMFSSEYSSCAENNGKYTLGDGYVCKLPGCTEIVKAYCTMNICNQNGANVCGHGRGLSQMGSNTLAKDYGYGYSLILSHYYNAQIGRLSDVTDLSIYQK